MTSEYEKGPELFDTPQESISEHIPEPPKPVRRVVRRRSSDTASQQVVVKVKTAEPAVENTASPARPEPVVQVRSEPVVLARPEPVVQARPEPVVQARPEPVVQARPEDVPSVPVAQNQRQETASNANPPRKRGRPSRNQIARVQKGVPEPVAPPAPIVAPSMEPMVEANTYNRERQEEREEREYAQSGSNQLPPTHSSQQSNNQTQSASYAMRNSPNRMQARNQNQNNKQNQNRQKPSHGKNNTFQNRPGRASYNLPEDLPAETYEDNPNAPRIVVNDLSVMSIPALRQRAMEANVSEDVLFEMKKQEIIVEVLKAHTAAGGVIFAYGSLEILPDGYGFLRSPQNNYLSGPEDIYISPSQIKLLNLKTGDTVEGQIRSPRDAERFFAMLRVQTINYDPPEMAKTRVNFDTLTPLYPDKRLNLETEEEDISTRLINLFCPIGKGQRSLIVAPPRAGKTILMQKIANAISANHPEVYLIVLLIDERPEEVTDMRRTVKGEVIASTFDEQATRHVSVAEMVIEKAKRLVEHKRDVVILLDNITRLARAYNQTVPASGKILSGGVDSNALHKPKRFLGAARNIEFGGSLTIIASALIETGSRMDEVIFEEFKGTGNNEIVLDRRMAERRMFPALNIKKSGTRREDLLLSAEETAKIWALRNAINPMEDIEMTELLIDKMKKTKNNEAFLRSMNTGVM